MTTHTQLIAQHFKQPGATLTALEALSLYGTARLASRVLELRQTGLNICSRMVKVSTRSGSARVAEYYLEAK